MNISFSLQQLSGTGNPDPKLITRHYKMNLVARFMQPKFGNPKNETIRYSTSIRLLK